MAARKNRPPVTLPLAFDALERSLDGETRSRLLDALPARASHRDRLVALRDSMRRHQFETGSDPVALGRIIGQLDKRTREEGFNVLHDWDGRADRLNADIIPVDVLNFLLDKPVASGSERLVLAVLLDYYFLYVLSLCALRAFDDGDSDVNFARLNSLLEALQGPDGSGHRFVADGETLVHVATSHFEAEENAYESLLKKVESLPSKRKVAIARAHAGILSSHLRFGFEATYGRDVGKLRDDNEADYPWLLFALRTLLDEWEAGDGADDVAREPLAESLLNGLTPDARAFIGKTPAFLSGWAKPAEDFRRRFEARREELVLAFERFVPEETGYSPLCLYFNFAHNVIKGLVVDALLEGRPWAVSLNDLLIGMPRDETRESSCRDAVKTLMRYAQASPDRIRGRDVPVIAYDLRRGRRAVSDALRLLRKP